MAEQAEINIHLYGDNDWDDSVGSVSSGGNTAEVDFTPNPWQRYTFGVRVVAAWGTPEANTHIVCFVRVNEVGELLPQALPRPFDVTTDRLTNNSVRVGFSCEVSPGFTTPSGFEILSDGGSGQLDEIIPIATVLLNDVNWTDFTTDVAVSSSPEIFAVRCIKGQQKGTVSKTVISTSLRVPPTPIIS